MKRRKFLATAAAGVALAPAVVRAQKQTTLKFIPQIDLAFLDPHWTTAYVTRNHSYLVFDTLYGTDGSYKSVSVPLNATTMQVTLPIGVDYKIGNDAILSKRLPFGTSLGIGVIPQLTMTNLEGISGFTAQYGYGCTPYAKMDISLFTGLCWKLRFLYTMGNINLLDVNAKLGNLNDGPFTISSSSQFMASFVIMPFSGGWKEFAWYNTYDTYNQHDRFN